MKYVILGWDGMMPALVRYMARRDPAAVWQEAFDIPAPHEVAIHQLCGPIAVRTDWEVLLLESAETMVLVSRWPDDPQQRRRRADQLRRLASSAVSVVALHPPCDSALAYEVLIEREQRGTWWVYHPALCDPLFQQLKKVAVQNSGQDASGTEQLLIEWQRPSCPPQMLRAELSRDLLLVSALCGPIEKVGGWGGALGGDNFDLALQLQTARGVLVRWSLAAAAEPQVRWTWVTGRQRISCIYHVGSGTWRVGDEDQQSLRHIWSQGGANGALDVSCPCGAEWAEFCHAEDALDTVVKAVSRRKILDVTREPYSEESAFKGVMATGSCLVLLALLLILVIGSIIEGIRYPSARARWRMEQRQNAQQGYVRSPPVASSRPLWWRLWPVYPLVFFLALQGLRLLIHSPSRSAQPVKPRDGSTAAPGV